MLPISYADATEIAQMLIAITRTQTGVTVPPVIIPNKTNNTIMVRATQPVIDVIQALVLANDKPRAEITLDIEILEVDRERIKKLGLDLSSYRIGGIFSPEVRRRARRNPPFNVNTISQGVSTADFYLSVPQAIVDFLAHRYQHEVSGQYAAAWRGRRAADAQGRSGRTVRDDDVLGPRHGAART